MARISIGNNVIIELSKENKNEEICVCTVYHKYEEVGNRCQLSRYKKYIWSVIIRCCFGMVYWKLTRGVCSLIQLSHIILLFRGLRKGMDLEIGDIQNGKGAEGERRFCYC